MKREFLKAKLNSIFNQYHKAEYLFSDPLQCVHHFQSKVDIEIAGLIAAVLAYGRVEIIIRSVNAVFDRIGKNVTDFTMNTTFAKKLKVFKGFKHRFNDERDMAILLQSISEIIQKYGSVEGLFKIYGDLPMHLAIDNFSREMKNIGTKIGCDVIKGFEYMFPSPLSGSACKRLNMYFRWMVRPADSIDLGVWTCVSPSVLIIPVDTHIARIAREMNLTRRKNADWKMAEEITSSLRKIDPIDPVRFDFSLCRVGMVSLRKDAV